MISKFSVPSLLTIPVILIIASVPFSQAKADVSASIQSLPNITIPPGTPLSFTVATSGFTSPVFTVSDSFSGSTASSNNIDASGRFSWVPTRNDSGNHLLTIVISDSSGSSTSLTEPITVNSAQTGTMVFVQTISPNITVNVGQPLILALGANNMPDAVYTVNDSFSGSTVSNSPMTTNQFTWTPRTSDIGTHNLTITANNSSGLHGSTAQTVNVTASDVIISNLNPGYNVQVGQQVSFTAIAINFTNPTFSMSDSFEETTAPNINPNSGSFIWTPTEADVGTHNINVRATDPNGRIADDHFQFYIAEALPTNSPTPLPTVTSTPLPTAIAPAALFTLTLTTGSTGQEVTFLQTILAKEGFYSGPINGTYSAQTKSAVMKLQKAYGLASVGTVGPGTRNILNELANRLASNTSNTADQFRSTLKVGSVGAEVAALQTQLKKDGIYKGPVNGSFGSLTKAAVEKFQSLHGLEKIGSVGPATRTLLNQRK